jgi:hypothetical protein
MQPLLVRAIALAYLLPKVTQYFFPISSSQHETFLTPFGAASTGREILTTQVKVSPLTGPTEQGSIAIS